MKYIKYHYHTVWSNRVWKIWLAKSHQGDGFPSRQKEFEKNMCWTIMNNTLHSYTYCTTHYTIHYTITLYGINLHLYREHTKNEVSTYINIWKYRIISKMSTLGELWQKICQHLAKIALRFGNICQSVNVDHIFGEDIVNVREC